MLPEKIQKNRSIEGPDYEWGQELAIRLKKIDAIIKLHDMRLLKSPGKIAMIGAEELSNVCNIDEESLKDIACTLQEFDYIKDANEWLGDKDENCKCP